MLAIAIGTYLGLIAAMATAVAIMYIGGKVKSDNSH